MWGGAGLLRARAGLAREPALEHVHADRARRGGLVRLQPDGAGVPRSDAAAASRQQGGGRPSTSRRRRRSSPWCCSGRCWSSRARHRTGAAIRALLDLSPKRALRIRPDGSDEEVPLGEVRGRRSAAGARRREDPGRRSRARRGERRRRVDDHRRADPGGQGAGRPPGGRHAERHRRAGDARRAGGARDAAGADRPDGRRGAAEPRADPADGRRRLGGVRAGRRRRGRRRLRWPGRWSARRRGCRTRWSPRSRC